ncbi:MAG: ATP-dependent RNA helicase RhlE [Parcubacteria group bacterium Gr01-1014_20]|nr:MAG: ATP-dependent RNA helicase RhlE [Parcubacteria group bacterium Gr01-1014_20]
MNNSSGFTGLGIAPGILAVLARHKFVQPTPIQARSIPVALEGKDLVGIAQTGTGKTLAFGIPMVQRILQKQGTGLIVLPTRELAMQVRDALQMVGGSLGIKTALLIGGAPMGRQVAEIRRRPEIVIGTPGRINDHLEQKTLTLSSVKILVLDEADRMLDMGFAPQLKRIMKFVPTERQTVLFSATMPPEIMNMARMFMKLPVQIEIAPPGTAAANVTHEVFVLGRDQKPALLNKLLSDYRGSVLVFTRTKFAARKVALAVRNFGHTANELHSNRSLSQRREALEGFKNGRYRVLVATDIAARGIDVTGIELVVNYDLPDQAEDYVHRIGRTGRAGASGHAISFATPDQRGDLHSIERLLKKSLPLARLPDSLPRVAFEPRRPFENKPRSFQSRSQGPSRSSSQSRSRGYHSSGRGEGSSFSSRPPRRSGFSGRRFGGR